jgi:methylenetetrahydrofolate reductase (NADPH)
MEPRGTMRLAELLANRKPSISLEIFPPKTKEAEVRLEKALPKLLQKRPAFINVTYGAGGSSKQQTLALVRKLTRITPIPIVPHISGISSSQKEVAKILECYLEDGIENILAVRGDPPKNAQNAPTKGDFRHAIELVRFIKARATGLCLGVAGFPEGHPESVSRSEELRHLKAKIEAGAEFIITQLFFDNCCFFEFLDSLEAVGIQVPVIAGILIATSQKQLLAIPGIAKGTKIPAPLTSAFQKAITPEQCLEVGVSWAAQQVEGILASKSPWVHLYTMNQARPLERLMERLSIQRLDEIDRDRAF